MNHAINELRIPLKVIEIAEEPFTGESVTNENENVDTHHFVAALVAMQEFTGMMYLAFTGCVLAVYRLREIRDHLLADWLFTDEELRAMGLPPLQEFIGTDKKWRNFEIVRHNLAGHSMIRKSTKNKRGRIIPARVLGSASREAGLADWKEFVTRVRKELTPAVQNIRDALVTEYPEARDYLRNYQTEHEFFEYSAYDKDADKRIT